MSKLFTSKNAYLLAGIIFILGAVLGDESIFLILGIVFIVLGLYFGIKKR